jgi:hypothetical protein
MAAKTWSGLLCAGAVALFDRFPIAAAISGVVGSALSFEVIDRQAAPPTRSLSSDWLDATTPLGIAVALASAAGVACLHRQTGVPIVCPAILAAPIFLSANRRLFAAPSERDPAAISGRVAQQTQLAFLRKSSITLSRSFNSRATTSGCGSKSTSADCSSS